MGDRANVHVTDEWDSNGVYLYTHWSGSELPERVRVALARGWRWHDAPYLTRIIFDTLTAGRQGEETGYGMSGRVGDGEDRIVHVDCHAQTVTLTAYGVSRTQSFAEYASADHQEWPAE